MRLFAFIFLMLALLVLSVCRSQADIEKNIAQSEELTRLNDLCNSIPVFHGSRLVGKQFTGNSEIRSIEVQFKKDQIINEKVERHYRQWAAANQWEQLGENTYRLNDKTVTIGFGRTLNTNYQIYCEEPR